MVAVATTRYCLLAAHDAGSPNATRFVQCSRPCAEELLVRNIENGEMRLYLKGNTQFYRNKKLPEHLPNLKRLVFNDFTADFGAPERCR